MRVNSSEFFELWSFWRYWEARQGLEKKRKQLKQAFLCRWGCMMYPSLKPSNWDNLQETQIVMCLTYFSMCFNTSKINIRSAILSIYLKCVQSLESKAFAPLASFAAPTVTLVSMLCHLHALNVQWSIPSTVQKFDRLAVSFQLCFLQLPQIPMETFRNSHQGNIAKMTYVFCRQRPPLVLASFRFIPSFLGKLKMNRAFHRWVKPWSLKTIFSKGQLRGGLGHYKSAK